MTQEKKHLEVAPLTVYSLIALIMGILTWTGGLMAVFGQVWIWCLASSSQIDIILMISYILMGVSLILAGIIVILLWMPRSLGGILVGIVLGSIGIVAILIGIDGAFNIITNLVGGTSMILGTPSIFSLLSKKD